YACIRRGMSPSGGRSPRSNRSDTGPPMNATPLGGAGPRESYISVAADASNVIIVTTSRSAAARRRQFGSNLMPRVPRLVDRSFVFDGGDVAGIAIERDRPQHAPHDLAAP